MRSEVELKELQGPGWFMFFQDAVRIESTSIPGTGRERPLGDIRTHIDYKTDYSHVGFLQLSLTGTAWLDAYRVPAIGYEYVGRMVEAVYGHADTEAQVNFNAAIEAKFEVLGQGSMSFGAVGVLYGGANFLLDSETTISVEKIADRYTQAGLTLKSETQVEFTPAPVTKPQPKERIYLSEGTLEFSGESVAEFVPVPENEKDFIQSLQLDISGTAEIDVSVQTSLLFSHYNVLKVLIGGGSHVETITANRPQTSEEEILLLLAGYLSGDDF